MPRASVEWTTAWNSIARQAEPSGVLQQRLDAGVQSHARAALESIRDQAGLSRDVGEVVGRALGEA